MTSVLQLVKPEEYFRDKITAARSDLKIAMEDSLEYYLVNLLCEFITPEKLNSPDDNLNVLSTPLAIMLKKAIEAAPGNQVKIFKRLGDTSLYVAGFFQGYFERKTVDLDYYISMGSSAYKRLSILLSERHNDEHFGQMYGDLADEFNNLVEIISAVSESHPTARDDKDLLAIYDRYAKTNSERLRRCLEENGIFPTTHKKSSPQ